MTGLPEGSKTSLPVPHTGGLYGTAYERAAAIAVRCGGGCEGKPGEWRVCCPAHDDHHPSLVITARGDHVLLKCWSGCTPEAIVTAIGLRMCDLFSDDLPLPRPEVGPDALPLAKRPCPTVRVEPSPAWVKCGAHPGVLDLAMEMVCHDVSALRMDGIQATFRAAHRVAQQWLWCEQQFWKHGLRLEDVEDVLWPEGRPERKACKAGTAGGGK